MLALPLLDDVRANDAEIVVGNMRKRWAAVDIAQPVHSGHVRLQLFVYANASPAVGRDPRGCEI